MLGLFAQDKKTAAAKHQESHLNQAIRTMIKLECESTHEQQKKTFKFHLPSFDAETSVLSIRK